MFTENMLFCLYFHIYIIFQNFSSICVCDGRQPAYFFGNVDHVYNVLLPANIFPVQRHHWLRLPILQPKQVLARKTLLSRPPSMAQLPTDTRQPPTHTYHTRALHPPPPEHITAMVPTLLSLGTTSTKTQRKRKIGRGRAHPNLLVVLLMSLYFITLHIVLELEYLMRVFSVLLPMVLNTACSDYMSHTGLVVST